MVTLPTGDTVSVSSDSPGLATDSSGVKFRITPQLAKSAFASAARSAQVEQNTAALAASEQPEASKDEKDSKEVAKQLDDDLAAAAGAPPAPMPPGWMSPFSCEKEPGEKHIARADVHKSVGQIFKMKSSEVPADVSNIHIGQLRFAAIAVELDDVLVGPPTAHIMTMLVDQSQKFADVLPFFSPAEVQKFFSDDGFLDFAKAQKRSVASCLERAYALVQRRVQVDNVSHTRHKALMDNGVLNTAKYAAEILRLHALNKEAMAALHEACWREKEKANEEKLAAKISGDVQVRTADTIYAADGKTRKPNRWGKNPPKPFDPDKDTIAGWLTDFTEEVTLWFEKCFWLAQLLDHVPAETKKYLTALRQKITDEWQAGTPDPTEPAARNDAAGNRLEPDMTFDMAGFVLTKQFPESFQRNDLLKSFHSVRLTPSMRVRDLFTALDLANRNLERAVGQPTDDWRYCCQLLQAISNPKEGAEPWALETKIKEMNIGGRSCENWTKEELLRQIDVLGRVHHDLLFKNKREESAAYAGWQDDRGGKWRRQPKGKGGKGKGKGKGKGGKGKSAGGHQQKEDWQKKASAAAQSTRDGGKNKPPWKHPVTDRSMHEAFVAAHTTPHSTEEELAAVEEDWQKRMNLSQTDWQHHPELFATDKIVWDGDWLDACKKCQHIGLHNGASCPAAKNGRGKKNSRNRGGRW